MMCPFNLWLVDSFKDYQEGGVWFTALCNVMPVILNFLDHRVIPV